MAKAVLTISSRNYSSWSMRGWLLARFAGLEFDVETVPLDDPGARAEMLLLAPSILVPRLTHEDVTVWDTLAIGEYLHEIRPDAGLLPAGRAARAHCRAVCGEMHSGFVALRSALPMNLKARFPGYKVRSQAQADIDHVVGIWSACLQRYGGPFLFGPRGMADAMFAPVVTRLQTYDVQVPDPSCIAYGERMLDQPEVREWVAAAHAEPDSVDALEVQF